MNNRFSSFKRKIYKPFGFDLFLLGNLPAAFFAGLKIEELTEEQAVVSVRYKWFNKNPFRSIYFAILSMAAEVSTGILCMAAIYQRKPAVSMLLTECKGSFIKKAVGKMYFTCNMGEAIDKEVESGVTSNDAFSIICQSTGKNEAGETVAQFYFTWSFKQRSQ